MEQIDKHIPITKVCSIDEVACRLIGHEREEEKALEIGRNLKKAILQNVGPCLRSSVGIGPNRFLA